MKIVYLINGMYNSAGRERVVANKAKFLTERGHLVTIITTDQKNKPYYYKVPSSVKKVDLKINNDDYKDLSIMKKVFSFLRNDRLFRNKIKTYFTDNPQDVVVTLEDRFIPSLIQVVKDNSIIIAESHFNKFAFVDLGKSVNRNFLQRMVYSMRNMYIQKIYYNKLDAYVLLTREDFDYWEGEKSNIAVIPNSIDYNFNKQALLDNKIVIAVGRLSYQKGFERLVQSWRIVHLQCPEWVLHIYGDGDDKDKLIMLITQYGLQDNIKIFHSTPNIEEELLSSSIYVLSSRFEGLPMVLLEAMSLGLPIVSYDCKTGPKDIIINGYNGYLVAEGNIRSLAERIIFLIKKEGERKRIGSNAKLHAQKYSHDVIAKQWEELFEKLIRLKNEKNNILFKRKG